MESKLSSLEKEAEKEERAIKRLELNISDFKEIDEECLIPGSVCTMIGVANEFPKLISSEAYKDLKKLIQDKLGISEMSEVGTAKMSNMEFKIYWKMLIEIEPKNQCGESPTRTQLLTQSEESLTLTDERWVEVKKLRPKFKTQTKKKEKRLPRNFKPRDTQLLRN